MTFAPVEAETPGHSLRSHDQVKHHHMNTAFAMKDTNEVCIRLKFAPFLQHRQIEDDL